MVAGVDSCGHQVMCPVVEYLPSACPVQCPHVHTKCPVQCPHVQCRAGEEDELQCSHVSGVSPGSAVQWGRVLWSFIADMMMQLRVKWRNCDEWKSFYSFVLQLQHSIMQWGDAIDKMEILFFLHEVRTKGHIIDNIRCSNAEWLHRDIQTLLLPSTHWNVSWAGGVSAVRSSDLGLDHGLQL